jgi:hypothetical protein
LFWRDALGWIGEHFSVKETSYSYFYTVSIRYVFVSCPPPRRGVAVAILIIAKYAKGRLCTIEKARSTKEFCFKVNFKFLKFYSLCSFLQRNSAHKAKRPTRNLHSCGEPANVINMHFSQVCGASSGRLPHWPHIGIESGNKENHIVKAILLWITAVFIRQKKAEKDATCSLISDGICFPFFCLTNPALMAKLQYLVPTCCKKNYLKNFWRLVSYLVSFSSYKYAMPLIRSF